MVSRLAKPQRGQVNTDSRIISLIAASLHYRRRIARIRGGAGQRLGFCFVWIVSHNGSPLREIDLDIAHAGNFFKRLPDRNRTDRAGHVLDIERDVLGVAAIAIRGSAARAKINSLRIRESFQ